jgi:type I restriction enzyme M protein
MTQKELENYLWGAANILRGMIDAADFKQYIFPLLFFKRVSDIWDEEYQEAIKLSDGDLDYAKFRENHRFQIPDGCHWSDIRAIASDIGKMLQNALHKIEKANFELLHDVFGDAQWTNKRRLSDEKLIDLIEHFSQMNLAVKNVPHDMMGDGYEYLINKFADDSGHTAAEFYTNRTVVELMTCITDPQPGESVYDPTCGSGGILLNSALYLKKQDKEYRNLKLFGQELNLITSAIARMNMFMHAIDEFLIVQGDTLDQPQILENDEIKQFDVVMANPPYSTKRWSQAKFANDPFGRNIWGTPSQGCADYAFQQHIIKSLKPDTGRSVSLWPHGVLFREKEADMRKKMIEEDVVEAVIGLGKNLFYNSSMESCLLVCNLNKPKKRKGKIIFIDGKDEIRLERSTAYLKDEHIKRLADAYWNFRDESGFTKVMETKTLLDTHGGNLSIALHVKTLSENNNITLNSFISNTKRIQEQISKIFGQMLKKIDKLDFNNEIPEKKKNWDNVQYGDVVDHIENNERDVEKRATAKYVSVEHLETLDLRIKGVAAEEQPTFLRTFKKGQVLFAKRRAYQKKVAVADFDGICSPHLWALEAKGKLIQDLLPFIMQRDHFYEYVNANSAGGMSTYLKWPALSEYQFKLPPKSEQAEFVKVFNTIESLTYDLEEEIQSLKKLKQKLLDEILG